MDVEKEMRESEVVVEKELEADPTDELFVDHEVLVHIFYWCRKRQRIPRRERGVVVGEMDHLVDDTNRCMHTHSHALSQPPIIWKIVGGG